MVGDAVLAAGQWLDLRGGRVADGANGLGCRSGPASDCRTGAKRPQKGLHGRIHAGRHGQRPGSLRTSGVGLDGRLQALVGPLLGFLVGPVVLAAVQDGGALGGRVYCLAAQVGQVDGQGAADDGAAGWHGPAGALDPVAGVVEAQGCVEVQAGFDIGDRAVQGHGRSGVAVGA